MPLRLARGGFLSLVRVTSPFDPSASFVTSYVCGPTTLAAIRLLLAVYTFVTILYVLIWNAVSIHEGDKFFAYFTHLTYIGICSYYWASAVQTAAYAVRLRKLKSLGSVPGGSQAELGSMVDYSMPVQYPLQRWGTVLQFLHVWLQTTVSTYPIVVTIVYWAILSSSSTFATTQSSWQAISIHILNTPLGLLDALLTNIQPAPWLYVAFNIFLLALYLALAYLANKTVGEGWYPYSFLDPNSESHGVLAGYVLGIAAGYAIVFVIVRLVMMLKMYLLRRSRTSAGQAIGGESKEDMRQTEPEAMDEWEVVEAPGAGRMSRS